MPDEHDSEARGDHARWMPPAAGAAPEAEHTRAMPAVGGAPGGGLVGGAAAPSADASPAEAGGTAHRTPVAEEASAQEAGEGDAAPRRRGRGLLPRKRRAGDAAPAAGAAAADGTGDAAPAAGAAAADGTGDAAATAPEKRRARKARSRSRRGADVPAAEPAAEPGEILDAKGRPATHAALRRERKAIIDRRQAAVYHLGGLAFELYRRDLLAEPVMRDRAGQLAALDERVRQIDALLGDKERRRRTRRPAAPAGPAGCCLSCRAPFDDGDRFCSSCGARLLPDAPPPGEELTGQITPRPA